MHKENNSSEEITFKDIVNKINEYYKEGLKNWWKICLIALIFGGFNFYKAYTTLPIYNAEIKFFLEGEGSNSGGLGGLLGSFGIKTGGGKNNPFQIIEVIDSKLQLTEVLFNDPNKKKEYLANKIIDTYDLSKNWEKQNPDFKNFYFKHDSIPVFSELEKQALVNIINRVKKDIFGPALRGAQFDEDRGFYSINSATISPDISYELTMQSYEKIKNFYEFKALQSYIQTRDILKSKLDSLDRTVRSKMYQINKFGDSNRGLVSLEKGTQKDILQREITGLSLAQAEAYKTYEMAEFNLQNRRNQFLIIDEPYQPINSYQPSILMNTLMGLFLGFLLGTILVIARRLYKEAMV